MWIYILKFKLKQEQLELIEEYLLASKVATIEEERALLQLQADFKPISNDEEDDASNIQTKIQH